MVARLPTTTARGFLLGGLPITDQRERYRAAWQRILEMVKALHAAKVTLVAGTDDLAGLMLHHELQLFASVGIPNADILRMATVGAASSLGLAKEVGSIARGLRADLVVVDGDPLARIADAERVVTTMRAGVRFDAAAVCKLLSVKPALGP
jgi:imidazolonepropionase-like amidohydrolase